MCRSRRFSKWSHELKQMGQKLISDFLFSNFKHISSRNTCSPKNVSTSFLKCNKKDMFGVLLLPSSSPSCFFFALSHLIQSMFVKCKRLTKTNFDQLVQIFRNNLQEWVEKNPLMIGINNAVMEYIGIEIVLFHRCCCVHERAWENLTAISGDCETICTISDCVLGWCRLVVATCNVHNRLQTNCICQIHSSFVHSFNLNRSQFVIVPIYLTKSYSIDQCFSFFRQAKQIKHSTREDDAEDIAT